MADGQREPFQATRREGVDDSAGGGRVDASERQWLIEQYAEGPARLEEAVAAVPSGALTWRPLPGAWSAHEVVCHCADAEALVAVRIRMLAVEPEPLIVGIDQDAWTAVLGYHGLPLGPALAAVGATRAHTAELLRRLPEEAWSREGRHTERGRYTADDCLRFYAPHLHGHARQIEENAAAWAARRRDGPAGNPDDT